MRHVQLIYAIKEPPKIPQVSLERIIPTQQPGGTSEMVAIFPTVLIAEDSADTLAMLKRALELRGYSVLEARNGVEALEIAKVRRPSLFIVDLNMPRLDGLETVKLIRTLEGWAHVPILAVTAFDVYGMEEAALEMGCNEYLSKPIDLSDLDRALRGLGFLV